MKLLLLLFFPLLTSHKDRFFFCFFIVIIIFSCTCMIHSNHSCKFIYLYHDIDSINKRARKKRMTIMCSIWTFLFVRDLWLGFNCVWISSCKLSLNICHAWTRFACFCSVNKFNWDADLREDRQFHLDYPGACTISTEQVPLIILFPPLHSLFVCGTISCFAI